MAVVDLNDENFREVYTKNEILIVDFWAPWCGPCRMLAQVIDQVAEAVADEAKVAKCNTDEAGGIAQKFGIASIPTILIFMDGEKVETLVGAAQNAAGLTEKIKSFL